MPPTTPPANPSPFTDWDHNRHEPERSREQSPERRLSLLSADSVFSSFNPPSGNLALLEIPCLPPALASRQSLVERRQRRKSRRRPSPFARAPPIRFRPSLLTTFCRSFDIDVDAFDRDNSRLARQLTTPRRVSSPHTTLTNRGLCPSALSPLRPSNFSP
jgi:hypothetical protein